MPESRSRRPLWRIVVRFDTVMVMIATIVVIWLAYIIPQNFDFLNPVGKAIGDVDVTDMVFSQFRSDQAGIVDTSIVLINIGTSSREEIAAILRRVNAYEPAAVGLDVFFRSYKDSAADAGLADAIRSTKNLVMVSKVDYKESKGNGSPLSESRAFDTLETSMPMFMTGARTGFANLVIDQEQAFMTCRQISLQDSCAGKIEPSFALALASIVSSDAAQYARNRGNEEETINYHGNYSSFYHVENDQVLDPEFPLEFIQGKIVLIGFMGATFDDLTLEDKFFTPMNEHYVGRAFPDMFGVVVHANVISMILRKDYINTMSFPVSILIGACILIFNVSLFTWMYERYESWYDVFVVIIQLAQSIGILFLIVFVFDRFLYKLALTPALMGVFLVGTVHDLYQDSLKKIILTLIQRWKLRGKSASSQKDVRI